MNNVDRNLIAKQHCNKLIAEFMGYEVKHGKCYSPKHNDGTIAPMQFDRSWDWLMPVVVKCFNEHDFNDDLNFRLNDALLETNIDSLYEAVVEFIKEWPHPPYPKDADGNIYI